MKSGRKNKQFSSIPEKHNKRKRRSCFGCFGRLLLLSLWIIPLLALVAGTFFLSFVLFPPFGNETAARVLLVGLDDKPREGGAQRSDSIILYSARLTGGGATLISVPRDARVRLAGHRRYSKINAAYADGGEKLLMETLAQPSVLSADIPYYIVFDSSTVGAAIDALGGIDVIVPQDMNYDDNWGNLHIHLKAGQRHLTGDQAIGYLRWRKNNNGRGSSDDFIRTERQRQILIAIKDKIKSWDGIVRTPQVLKAFKQHARTNLSVTQLMAMGWASQQLKTDAIPATPQMIGGVSYVICDWDTGRQLWENAIR